jgi:predicted outer membrane lipoprotein
MRPVNRRDLVVVAAGLALATWLVVRATYGALPPLRWWLPLPLGVLAVAEALGARTLRARLAAQREARRAGRGARTAEPAPPLVRPVEPMLVARLAVLAQASAFVGAVFVGVWAGVLLHVAPAVSRLQAAGSDTVTAVLGVVLAAALGAAALWLESVCRVPPEERDDQRPGSGVRA